MRRNVGDICTKDNEWTVGPGRHATDEGRRDLRNVRASQWLSAPRLQHRQLCDMVYYDVRSNLHLPAKQDDELNGDKYKI